MRTVRLMVLALTGVALICISLNALKAEVSTSPDSDHDGLSDALEQELLARFLPSFQVDPQDCADRPALFLPDRANPVVASEDGTIYGQATPRVLPNVTAPLVELRYFHLWRSDCGRMAHPLDAEHVSVLIQGTADSAQTAGNWRALFWYAAAHEDTVCDASQITRASTLSAADSGPRIWISRGKHASFLDRKLCDRGCGGDDCRQVQMLAVSRIVNLGEASAPMHGATWTESAEWPLGVKLARTDFAPDVLARVEQLPESDIAWVYPARRPAQATIAAGGSTADALSMSGRKTDTALSLAGDDAGNALDVSYDKVTRSLRKSAANVGRFLNGGVGPRTEPSGSLTKDEKH